jgi:hypothetical protein
MSSSAPFQSHIEDVPVDIFSCSFLANRRCPDGHLLQFALPCGNGKHIETIDMVSPINPRFPATINPPRTLEKKDVFQRRGFSFLFCGVCMMGCHHTIKIFLDSPSFFKQIPDLFPLS